MFSGMNRDVVEGNTTETKLALPIYLFTYSIL